MILAFEPPARLLNMNDRAHRLEAAKVVKAWRECVYFYACQAEPGPSKRRMEGRSRVRIALPVKGERRRDPHNYAPTQKALIDGLCDANVFVDDNAEWVTTPEVVLYQGTQVVVVIEPAESAPDLHISDKSACYNSGTNDNGPRDADTPGDLAAAPRRLRRG